ncbi:MAG: DUF2304 domain-containing protein [Candidatus Omnitrophica bacterium]|nr:DUF2304 domain-containing protein [Candidatus Omnitrophota bacterium]
MGIRVLEFLLSFSVFLFVVELVRREKLTFKYAFAWIFFSVIGVVFSLFPVIPYKISKVLGFELPSNFIFFSLLGMFVFLSLLLTVFLCQQNRRNDRMAQKIGLLEEEMRALQERMKGR